MVAMEVGMDIYLKQYSKLLSNTFHINHRSSLYLVKNLRFGLLYLVTGDLVAREVIMDIPLFTIDIVDSKTFPMSPRSSLHLLWLLR